MQRESPQTRRRLLILTAIVAVALAALALCQGVPNLGGPGAEPSSGTVRFVTGAAPKPPVVAARAPRSAPESTIIPGPRQWRVGGAHVPRCWDHRYRPKRLDPRRQCGYGDRIEFCTVGEIHLPPDIDVEATDALLTEVEDLLGLRREGRLTVLLYDWDSFKLAREERRLGPGVAGWFDGHVHVGVSFSGHRTWTVLRHEMLHGVMAPTIGCAPRSVHEGVADWFDGDIHVNAWNYMLWRGEALDPRRLDPLITSDDGYEVGLGYAEASARVHHAVATGGEEVLSPWLARIQEGGLTEPVAAWAALDATSREPIVSTIAEELLPGERWSSELYERLQSTSITCARVGGDEPGLNLRGREAQRRACALLDRDIDDPDLPPRLVFKIEHHDELLEERSEASLRRHEEAFIR